MPRGPKGNSPLRLTAICRITPEKQLSKVLRFGDVLTNFVRLIGWQPLSPVVQPSAVRGCCAALFAPARIRSGAYPMDGTCLLHFRVCS